MPNGSTRTLSIQQSPQRRYWFAMCPISCKVRCAKESSKIFAMHSKFNFPSSQIGDVKLCAGCKAVGYIGKDEQKEDWPSHKKVSSTGNDRDRIRTSVWSFNSVAFSVVQGAPRLSLRTPALALRKDSRGDEGGTGGGPGPGGGLGSVRPGHHGLPQNMRRLQTG